MCADILYETLRLVLETKVDSAAVLGRLVEGDDAGVVGPGRASPCDAGVRFLLGDLGLPFDSLPRDIRTPEQVRIALLSTSSTALMNCGNSSNCVHWL